MLNYKNKINFYLIRDIDNIYYFIIFATILTLICLTNESTLSIQETYAQISNTTTQNNNNNQIIQGDNSSTTSFILSGPMSSFISTPDGNWVVDGNWSLKVQNGNLSLFNAEMKWDPTNVTKKSHSHNFVNFRADPNTNITLGSDRIIDFTGFMDIGTNGKISWTNILTEIKIAKNTLTVLILDDSKTQNHFNKYPVFGKVEKVSSIGTANTNNINTNIEQSAQPPQSQTFTQSAQPPQSQTFTQSAQPIIPVHSSVKSFRLEGSIDSVVYTPTGSKWNTAGSWNLVVDKGKVTLFDINSTWRNATNYHTHEFFNFKTKAKSITLKPTNDLALKGVVDIKTGNNLSWTSVPATINIASGKTITILVDDIKTNHHFDNQPIHGIVNKLTLCSNTPSPNMEILPACS